MPMFDMELKVLTQVSYRHFPALAATKWENEKPEDLAVTSVLVVGAGQELPLTDAMRQHVEKVCWNHLRGNKPGGK